MKNYLFLCIFCILISGCTKQLTSITDLIPDNFRQYFTWTDDNNTEANATTVAHTSTFHSPNQEQAPQQHTTAPSDAENSNQSLQEDDAGALKFQEQPMTLTERRVREYYQGKEQDKEQNHASTSASTVAVKSADEQHVTEEFSQHDKASPKKH